MKQFKDSNGKTWEITVNVKTAERVRDILKVDLFQLFQTEANRLLSDPVMLVNVLWVLCEKQANKDGITDEDFGTALYGQAIEDAANALLEETADFFPPARRAILRKTLETSVKVSEAMNQSAMKKLDSVDEIISKMFTDSQA